MIRFFLLSALFFFSGSSIAAKKIPIEEWQVSRRIEYVDFQDSKVYPLLGVTNHPLVIEFPADQTLLEVAGGGVGGWDVQRRGSRLFVRALPEAVLSTLLVVTDAHTYVFDLVPAKPSPNNLKNRRSRFVFNAPVQIVESLPIAVEVPVPLSIPAEKTAITTQNELPLLQTAKAVELVTTQKEEAKPEFNRNYTMQIVKEDVIIRPKEVFDDGVFTWFLFPKSQAVPVLYKSIPGTKEETVTNFHMEGDYLVAHAISALWNLRLGGSLVGVYNESFEPTGLARKPR